MEMFEITGIEIEYSKLPKNRSNSMHPEAIRYRRAFARMNNALEGIIPNKKDKEFMDRIPLDISKEDFKEAVLRRLIERKDEL